MAKKPTAETLDVAMLPLSDGRQIMVPLQVIAEVQQVNFAGRRGSDLGEFRWRGYDLKIETLDAACGLPAPAPDRLTTVGVFKGDGRMSTPFRALAFSGTAAPGRVEADWLTDVDAPDEGLFSGATQLHDEVYLIPDLPKMLYGA